MGYTFVVQIHQSRNQLSINFLRFFFTHSTIWFRFQKTMGASSSNILQYKNYLILGFNCFIKLSNISMRNPFHQSDFSPYTLLSLNVFYFSFFINFKRNFFITFLVDTDSDNCICSLTYLFTQNIIIQIIFLRKYDNLRIFLFIFLFCCIIRLIILSCKLVLLLFRKCTSAFWGIKTLIDW